MINIAKAITDEDVRAAADYFAALKRSQASPGVPHSTCFASSTT